MKQLEILFTVICLSPDEFYDVGKVSIYSWILIFTTLCPKKPEFRVTSDFHDAWNKYSQRALLNHFSLLREMIFLFDEFSLDPQKKSEIRF